MKRLPRQVVLLGWISLLADVSGEMTMPLVPLYVTGVLGAGTVALGLIEGLAEAVVTLMKAASGWHSDRVRRRVPYIRWGYGLPVIGKAIIAASVAWPMVACGRVLDRVGKGLRTTPRDALLADAAPPEMRGHAFGLHRAMDTAGALAGVLIAAALLAALGARATPDDAGAWRLTLGLASAAGVGCWALTFLLRDVPHEIGGSGGHATQPHSERFNARYWRSVIALGVFALGNCSDAFLLLRASQVGLGPVQVILSYAVFNAVYAAASLPAGRLSDRLGRSAVLRVGWTLQGLSYLGFGLADAGWQCFPLMAMYGLAVACHEGVGKAMVADAAPRDRRGTALGIAYGVMGASALLASVGAGAVWAWAGPAWALGAGLVTSLAASLAMPSSRPAR
jgi:MFS family permease